MCPSCVLELKSEDEKHASMKSVHSSIPFRSMAMRDSVSVLSAVGCNCSACVAKRLVYNNDCAGIADFNRISGMNVTYVTICYVFPILLPMYFF